MLLSIGEDKTNTWLIIIYDLLDSEILGFMFVTKTMLYLTSLVKPAVVYKIVYVYYFDTEYYINIIF